MSLNHLLKEFVKNQTGLDQAQYFSKFKRFSKGGDSWSYGDSDHLITPAVKNVLNAAEIYGLYRVLISNSDAIEKTALCALVISAFEGGKILWNIHLKSVDYDTKNDMVGV